MSLIIPYIHHEQRIELEPFEWIINITLYDIQFEDGEIFANWYSGKHPFNGLQIDTAELHTIHTDAFNGQVFRKLKELQLIMDCDNLVTFHVGAFNGLVAMNNIYFEIVGSSSLPATVFDPIATTIDKIDILTWPNDINLNEMFSKQHFDELHILYISNVDMPRTVFRVVAASNFSSFCCLLELFLIRCGIEVIEDDAFDVIGRNLRYLDLRNNRIKFIGTRMFRPVFESEFYNDLDIKSEVEFKCSCRFIAFEVIQCPYRAVEDLMCTDCLPRDFDADACGVYRTIENSKLCPYIGNQYETRIIDVRLAYDNGLISINTNFSDPFRMLLIVFDAPRPNDCMGRAKNAYAKCFYIERATEHLELDAIDAIRDAELVFVTAIPNLRQLGANPMPTMTVRRTLIVNENSNSLWLCLGFIIISGAVIGFLGGIFMRFGRESDDATDIATEEPTNDTNGEEFPVYEYITSMQFDDGHVDYEEINEEQTDSNYLELVDTGYMAVE